MYFYHFYDVYICMSRTLRLIPHHILAITTMWIYGICVYVYVNL